MYCYRFWQGHLWWNRAALRTQTKHVPLKKDWILFTVIFSRLTIQTMYGLTLHRHDSFRAWGQLEAVWQQSVRQLWQTEGPWTHLQPPLLLILPLLSDSLLSSPQPEEQNQSHNQDCTNAKNPHEYESAAETATHPSEVIHVGGLNWSAYEGQVVNFCCLLISLVRLDKQLQENRGKKANAIKWT